MLQGHPVMGKVRTSQFSRCRDGDVTIIAMNKGTEKFEHIETLACPR
ncbi:hypothetical protein [Aurantiacibacter spongiae]|nr:hypothetical protein [Aurantiacibacter spongiae]